ncbi:unnamed protein product, partial [Ectocarpus sp. 12 AP-2014]
MWTIFRAQDGILARHLWWDDDAEESASGSTTVSIGPPAFKSTTPVGGTDVGGGSNTDEWEIRRDRSDARHCLRQFVVQAMALADFFARDNPRGKAVLENFTPLLRMLIGSGLGACEVLATIRRDNPRTYA